MGIRIPVKADIRKINAFSAHADYNEIIKWMKGYKKKPKKVFLTHGEHRSARALKQKLGLIGFECYIPNMGEIIEL